MYKDALRAAWAEINITNLDFNIKQIKEKVGSGVKITGVVKADAYGHGSVRVATVLRANGIESFAVATLSEAVRLRKAGFLLEEIMVPLHPGTLYRHHHRTPTVTCSLRLQKCGGYIQGCSRSRHHHKGLYRGRHRYGPDRLQRRHYVCGRCEDDRRAF